MEMMPALVFNLNPVECKNMFYEILEYLETEEKNKYPNHKQKLLEELQIFEESKKVRESEIKSLKMQLEKCKTDDDRKSLMSEISILEQGNSLGKPDINTPHPSYTFNVGGKSVQSSDMKKLSDLIKESGENVSSYHDCPPPLWRALRRGIGLYLENMPTSYLQMIQQLASDKKLGLIISDRGLVLGVNMPIDTVMITGQKRTEITSYYSTNGSRWKKRIK